MTSASDWNEALERLVAYLASVGVSGSERRMRLALELLDRARQGSPAGPPVESAMREAIAAVDGWFGEALDGASGDFPDRIAAGLAALRVSGASERWPDAVLNGPPAPELRRALADAVPRAAPDLAISRMIPREMDFGAMETLAQETWHQFAWAPLLRAAALWTAIFFAALYIYDRFFAS